MASDRQPFVASGLAKEIVCQGGKMFDASAARARGGQGRGQRPRSPRRLWGPNARWKSTREYRALIAPRILRGLRALSDFEYEFQMAGFNSRLTPARPESCLH
jgi:hypothetical protein